MRPHPCDLSCMPFNVLQAVSARQIPTGLLTVPMSGEMGLGFSAIATATDTPFWHILLENGQIPTYEMAFWLARIPDSKNSQLDGKVGGKLTLGGVDSQLFSGEIEFRNLTSGDSGLPPSYWSLQLAGEHICDQLPGIPVELL